MADEKKKDRIKAELENLPPGELKKHIEEDQKKIKRSIRFTVTALIAIIALCIAWFVNNTRVNATGAKVAAGNGINFELATTGDSEVIDAKKKPIHTFIEAIGGIAGDVFSLEEGTSEKAGTVTSLGKSSIQWNMSAEHRNFANVEGSGQIDGTGDENIGLQPGAYGELTFYIIPKIDGEQTVNCTVSLTPYGNNGEKEISFTQDGKEEKVYEITDSEVKKILSGHIYFFQELSNNLYDSWLQPDENGTLHFSVKLDENTQKDTPKKVTLYWNWPMLLSQVLLQEGDTYLGSRNQLFDQTAQDKIVEFMKTNTSFFFYASGNVNTGELIDRIHNASWKKASGTDFTREEYSEINQPYNNADQFLGKKVSYVSLELNATN